MRHIYYKLKQLQFAVIILALSIAFFKSDTSSALEYQSSTNVQFAFDPTISVNVSGDLIIDNLVPGSYSDSNVITVDVSTNTTAGYTLTTTVGKKAGTDGVGNPDTYLTNTASNSHKFTSLSSNISELSNFSENTWGYSYSLDNGTTWISGDKGSTANGYNGLPQDNNDTTSSQGNGGITLVDVNTNTQTPIKFKIGARASTTLPSGSYTNTVNFYALSKPMPISFYDAFAAAGKSQYNGYYKMQDMTASICSNVHTSQLEDNSDTMEAQLIDIRDGNLYWVAKLKDGNCWMTQNLDLDIETSSTAILTSENTDLNVVDSGAYASGYSTSGDIITWMPVNSTIDISNSETEPISISGWTNDNSVEYSVNPGNWYENPIYYDSSLCYVNSYTQTCNFITKTSNVYADYFTTDISESNSHRHLGNYYNWSAAIASNNSSSIVEHLTTANNSICPKAWRLPQVSNSVNEFADLNSFYNTAYSGTSQKDYGIFNAPFYGVRAGNISNNYMYNAGYYGNYLSGTAHNIAPDLGAYAYTLYFRSDNLRDRGTYGRGLGWSIRCLAR